MLGVSVAVGVTVGVKVAVGDGVKVRVEGGVGGSVAVSTIAGNGAAPQRLGVVEHPTRKMQTSKVTERFTVDYFNMGIFNP